MVALLTTSVVAIAAVSTLMYSKLKIDANFEQYHVDLKTLGQNGAGEYVFLLTNLSDLPVFYFGESEENIEYWVHHRNEIEGRWRFYWVNQNTFETVYYRLEANSAIPIYVTPPTNSEWYIGVNTVTAPYFSSYVVQVVSDNAPEYFD